MPKRDLLFAHPFMNAAGTLGFAPDLRAELPWQAFGAFVTNPISFRPRRPAASPSVMEFPGGFLMHTGLPNRGFPSVLRRFQKRWQEAPLPVIVSLMADRPEETRRMVQALEGVDNVLAVELGFAPLLAPDIIALAVELCRGELPLMVSLPAEQILDLGGRLIELGAAALVLSPPHGALSEAERIVTGRLFGPSVFPRSLETVHSAAKLGLPVVGAGGIRSKADAAAMLSAGALAVQLDSMLWLPGPSALKVGQQPGS